MNIKTKIRDIHLSGINLKNKPLSRKHSPLLEKSMEMTGMTLEHVNDIMNSPELFKHTLLETVCTSKKMECWDTKFAMAMLVKMGDPSIIPTLKDAHNTSAGSNKRLLMNAIINIELNEME